MLFIFSLLFLFNVRAFNGFQRYDLCGSIQSKAEKHTGVVSVLPRKLQNVSNSIYFMPYGHDARYF